MGMTGPIQECRRRRRSREALDVVRRRRRRRFLRGFRHPRRARMCQFARAKDSRESVCNLRLIGGHRFETRHRLDTRLDADLTLLKLDVKSEQFGSQFSRRVNPEPDSFLNGRRKFRNHNTRPDVCIFARAKQKRESASNLRLIGGP